MAQVTARASSASLQALTDRLTGAADIDAVARGVLDALTAVPGALRIGLALSEGGGRRLRFTASDRLDVDDLVWCHIDAYDDVPLTTVVRSGSPLLGDRPLLERRFPAYAARQDATVRGIAALPLPGGGDPIGGCLVILDRPWSDVDIWRSHLESVASLTAWSIGRVQSSGRGASADRSAPTGLGEARLVLADDPRSAGAARRFLCEVLGRHPEVSGDVIETAELCLSELVTNALVHVGGESELSVVVADGVVTCAVRDHGTAAPLADPNGEALADPMRVHGRGLQLIEMLTDRWGSEPDAGGSTTWFALSV